ncbi:MAG: homoserine kinase [Gemmatimonadales bacterium]
MSHSGTQQRAVAYAPGSVGNVGPGLDILGLAVEGAGDEVSLNQCDGDALIIVDPGHPALPREPNRHASAIAAASVFARAGYYGGIELRLRKGLPLAGGLGGSAASAVAGAVAANALCGAGLDAAALLECALEAESTVAGRHADNLAASLHGGLVLVRSLDPIDVVALPVPANLLVVLVHPEQQLRTRDARAVLPESLPRDVALAQAANVAAMVAGACRDDLALLGRACEDRIAEPARRSLLPGFVAAQRAARDANALACSISGAGPTAFALVGDAAIGRRVVDAMTAAYAAAGVIATGRVAAVDREGARLR